MCVHCVIIEHAVNLILADIECCPANHNAYCMLGGANCQPGLTALTHGNIKVLKLPFSIANSCHHSPPSFKIPMPAISIEIPTTLFIPNFNSYKLKVTLSLCLMDNDIAGSSSK